MNGQEYLQAVKAKFEREGWQVQSKQLDSDVVLLQGKQGDRTVLCMAIAGEATGAHVQRLVEFAEDAGVSTVAIAARSGYATAARTVIDQHGIERIEIDGGDAADEVSGEGVSRRTAAIAVGGAGLLGLGGFYVTSTMDGLPSILDGGGSIGPMPITTVSPNLPELDVSGNAVPVPEAEDASEVEIDITAGSSFDDDVDLELVAVTFVDGDGTILSDVEIRETRNLPSGGTIGFDGTYDVDDPPDWGRATSITVAFRVDS